MRNANVAPVRQRRRVGLSRSPVRPAAHSAKRSVGIQHLTFYFCILSYSFSSASSAFWYFS